MLALVLAAAPHWVGLRMHEEKGRVQVAHVLKQSPAACAGLEAGDEIVSVQGSEVHSPREVSQRIAEAPGAVSMRLRRRSADLALEVSPADRPSDSELARLDLLGTPLPPFHQLKSATSTRAAAPSAAELAGHVVLVEYGASWCGPCRESGPVLQAIADAYPPTSLVVLGITREKEDVRVAYEDPRHFTYAGRSASTPPFSILRDVEGDLSGASSASLLPTFVLYGPDGTARWVHAGAGSQLRAELDTQIQQAISSTVAPKLGQVLADRDGCGRRLPRPETRAPLDPPKARTP